MRRVDCGAVVCPRFPPISRHRNSTGKRANEEGENVREPDGALAGTASAHERVHDGVALAQVGRVARDGWSNIGVIVGDQVGDYKSFLGSVL